MIVTAAPLYAFDASSVPVRLKPFFKRTTAAASASNTVNIDLVQSDSQYALIVRNINLECNLTNAADNYTEASIRWRSPAGDATQTQGVIAEDVLVKAAGVRVSVNWQGDLLFLPGWSIRGTATKAASANTQTVLLDVIGYLVPVGNLSLSA